MRRPGICYPAQLFSRCSSTSIVILSSLPFTGCCFKELALVLANLAARKHCRTKQSKFHLSSLADKADDRSKRLNGGEKHSITVRQLRQKTQATDLSGLHLKIPI